MRRRLALSFATLVCSSCSLFTSFGELSEGAPAPGDGGNLDGTGGSDAAGGDGAGDAGIATTDGGPRFCATVDASFCDDFDDPADAVFFKWTVTAEAPDGTVTRTSNGFSPPNAATCRATSTGDQISAYLARSFFNVNRTRMQYRFRVEEQESAGFLQIGQLNLDAPGDARTSMRLTLGGGTAHFEGAVYPNVGGPGTFPKITPNFTLTAQEWHSVDMTVDWQATPATVTIDFDTVRVADKAEVTGATFGPGTLFVAAGIYYLEGGSGPWRIAFDDVALTIE